MRPARRFEASDQHLVAGVEEQDAGAGTGLAHLGERGVEVVDERAGARVDDEREPGRPLPVPGQLRDRGDQRRREVVDDEEPEVLEDVSGRGPPGPGEPGDDEEVEGRSAHALTSCSRSYTARATVSGSHDNATSSSSVRARSRFTDPDSLRSRARRVGPRPATSSSTDRVACCSRRRRWYVIANRCASSRTCWSRYKAG